MPTCWTIASRQQLVVATAEGDVTGADAEVCLDAIAGGSALAVMLLHDQALKLFTDVAPAQRWIDSLATAQ